MVRCSVRSPETRQGSDRLIGEAPLLIVLGLAKLCFRCNKFGRDYRLIA
jgi:hypothetical protein